MNKLSNLQQRLIAALIGGTLIVSSILFNEWSFFVLFGALSALCLIEFNGLFKKAGYAPNSGFGICIGLGNFILMFFYTQEQLDPKYFGLNLPALIILFISELYRNKSNPLINVGITLLGIFYVSLPFVLLNNLAFLSGNYSGHLVLGPLLMLWANDSGAYAFGKWLGKHKLFERISPNKTWQGFFGGALTAGAAGAILFTLYPQLELWKWISLGGIVAVSATYGDLFESLLKRSLNIKDSGSVIPGHGGFLDRFDGLLLIIPVILIYLELI